MSEERIIPAHRMEVLLGELESLRANNTTPFAKSVDVVANEYVDMLQTHLRREPDCTLDRFEIIQFEALQEAFTHILPEPLESMAQLQAVFLEYQERKDSSSYTHFLLEPEQELVEPDEHGIETLKNTEYCHRKPMLDKAFHDRAKQASVPIDASAEIHDFEVYTKLATLSSCYISTVQKLETVLTSDTVPAPQVDTAADARLEDCSAPSSQERDDSPGAVTFLSRVKGDSRFLTKNDMRAVGAQMKERATRAPHTGLGNQINRIIDAYNAAFLQEMLTYPLMHAAFLPDVQFRAAEAAYICMAQHDGINDPMDQVMHRAYEQLETSNYAKFIDRKCTDEHQVFDSNIYLKRKKELDAEFCKEAPKGYDAQKEIRGFEEYLKMATIECMQAASHVVFEEHAKPLKSETRTPG